MILNELIDYLSQFDGNCTVVFSGEDYPEAGEFIALDTLDYSTGQSASNATAPEDSNNG